MLFIPCDLVDRSTGLYRGSTVLRHPLEFRLPLELMRTRLDHLTGDAAHDHSANFEWRQIRRGDADKLESLRPPTAASWIAFM
jgi:hypothetical protein